MENILTVCLVLQNRLPWLQGAIDHSIQGSSLPLLDRGTQQHLFLSPLGARGGLKACV